jgi:hypothetical protein
VALVPVLGKWGKGDEKGVGHQAIGSYNGDLVSQADNGLVKVWQQRVRSAYVALHRIAAKRSSRKLRRKEGAEGSETQASASTQWHHSQ